MDLMEQIKMAEHKQVMIHNPALNYMIDVDEGIAPLLDAIWNLGIVTCNSCQENTPGVIWIEFSRAKDAEIFLTRIVSGLDPINSPEADNWLYSRVIGQNGVGQNGGWKYSAHPHDFREYIDMENNTLELDTSEPCGIGVSISIRFPIKDYERLLDLIGG